jgi:hypothetical protein
MRLKTGNGANDEENYSLLMTNFMERNTVQKLVVAQLVDILFTASGARRFITAFTRAHNRAKPEPVVSSPQSHFFIILGSILYYTSKPPSFFPRFRFFHLKYFMCSSAPSRVLHRPSSHTALSDHVINSS